MIKLENTGDQVKQLTKYKRTQLFVKQKTQMKRRPARQQWKLIFQDTNLLETH